MVQDLVMAQLGKSPSNNDNVYVTWLLKLNIEMQ